MWSCRVLESLERDHNDKTNIWQVYPSTNICVLNHMLEQNDNHSHGCLYNAQTSPHFQIHNLCLISGFRRNVDQICAPLGYYATSSGRSVPTFRYDLWVSSSRARKSKTCPSWTSWPLKTAPIRGPETSVHNDHSTLRSADLVLHSCWYVFLWRAACRLTLDIGHFWSKETTTRAYHSSSSWRYWPCNRL
jgi:hypothetical protein